MSASRRRLVRCLYGAAAPWFFLAHGFGEWSVRLAVVWRWLLAGRGRWWPLALVAQLPLLCLWALARTLFFLFLGPALLLLKLRLKIANGSSAIVR